MYLVVILCFSALNKIFPKLPRRALLGVGLKEGDTEGSRYFVTHTVEYLIVNQTVAGSIPADSDSSEILRAPISFTFFSKLCDLFNYLLK